MKVKINHKTRHTEYDVHIDPGDVWNLDTTLAHIILPMLIQLRKQGHGIPNDFLSEVGTDIDRNYCFDFIDEDRNEVFEKGAAKWYETMDKMIWAFSQLVEEDYELAYHHGDFEYTWVEEPDDQQILNPLTGKMERLSRLHDKNPNSHWVDFDGKQLHEQRMREGFELFGKYYRSLWD